MIEREAVISCITSTEFLQQVRPLWNPQLIESVTARMLITWCIEYFDTYHRAPLRDIQTVYYTKLPELKPEVAAEIEQDILPSLNEEFLNNPPNIDYTLTKTKLHLRKRHALLFGETLLNVLERGTGGEEQRVAEAERLASDYKPLATEATDGLDLNSPAALDRVAHAFTATGESVIWYPGVLGDFWNDQLVRGRLVALMAMEKRGKTFNLLDMAIRACRQGQPVVFFSAGDETEEDMLIRTGVYLNWRSEDERYCGQQWEPVCDCIQNQLNECRRGARECSFGAFVERDEAWLHQDVTIDHLIEAYAANPDYTPCTGCEEYNSHRWGTPWLIQVNVGQVLTVEEAQQSVQKFFIDHQRRFKLSTHPTNTLSVQDIEALLDVWERQDGFIPTLIVIDYADLLTGHTKEFRHLQNEIWCDLRALSQKRNKPLVITATQADADSYQRTHLTLSNFSEDKRKYAHCNAVFGLNQDPKGREKHIGLMRINKLIGRKGEFFTDEEVTILQNLRRGRPFIGCYR